MRRRGGMGAWVVVGVLATRVAAGAADVPLDGRSLRVTDPPDPQKRRNVVTLRDADVALAGVDPTASGAEVRIGRAGAATTFVLPADGWRRRNGKRTRFTYRSQSGPMRAARLVDGRTIALTARGPGAYGLGATAQGEVAVTVAVGGTRFCSVFGGTIARDDGKKFRATRAAAPAACPALGVTATTTVGPTTTLTMPSPTVTTTSTTTSTSTTTTTAPPCFPADGAGHDSATGCACLGTFDCCGICSANKLCTGPNRAPSGPDPGAALSCYEQDCNPADNAGHDNVTGCPCIGTFDCCGICSANHFCTGANRPPSGPDPGAAPSCF